MKAIAQSQNRLTNDLAALEGVAGAKIAFVVLKTTGDSFVPAYNALLRGVSAGASKYRLDLHVSLVSDPNAAITELSKQPFSGLIIHGTFDSIEQVEPLMRIPTVWLMGNRSRPVWGDQVMPDNTAIGQLAAQHLLLRHRSVLYFGFSSGWSLDIRQLAFQQAIEDAGGEVIAVVHQLRIGSAAHQDEEDARASLIRAYKKANKKPTAIFISEDWLVRSVFTALRSAGISPGTDLEAISCNNDRPYLLGVSPMPPTIDIRYELIGYQAIEQLCKRLMGHGLPDRVRTMLSPIIVYPQTAEKDEKRKRS